MRSGTKVVALITATMALCLPFVSVHEGESLNAYQDPVGVWTICRGHTIGVEPGMMKTKDECAELTNKTLIDFMAKVAAAIHVDVKPKTLAAHTSFAYNIGISAYKRSQALRYTNEGDLLGGCNAMLNWYTAGGRDCRIKRNNCYGLIKRRDAEVAMCIEGVAEK